MVLRSHQVIGAIGEAMLLLLVALAGSGILPLGVPNHAAPPGPISVETSNNFDQLVVVLMENRNLNEVYGPATYMTQLADTFAFSTGWTSITNPSQPNYIALIGGSTFGVSGDGNHPNLNHPTIVDLLENTSKTWKAFDEGYTTPPYVYTAFIGTAANLAYKSSAAYSHYSFSKLLEDVWGGGNLGQNDVTAPSPVEFFQPGGPDFGISASPTNVSFGSD